MNALRSLTRITVLVAIATAAAANAAAQSVEEGASSLRHSIVIENIADYPQFNFYLVHPEIAAASQDQPVSDGAAVSFDAGQSPQLQARMDESTVGMSSEGHSLTVAVSQLDLGDRAELPFCDPTREVHNVYRIIYVACGDIGLEHVSSTYVDFEGKQLPNNSFIREHYHSMLAGDAGMHADRV